MTIEERINEHAKEREQDRLDLWDDLSEGRISEEEWELQMWARGYLPDDHFSDEDDIPF